MRSTSTAMRIRPTPTFPSSPSTSTKSSAFHPTTGKRPRGAMMKAEAVVVGIGGSDRGGTTAPVRESTGRGHAWFSATPVHRTTSASTLSRTEDVVEAGEARGSRARGAPPATTATLRTTALTPTDTTGWRDQAAGRGSRRGGTRGTATSGAEEGAVLVVVAVAAIRCAVSGTATGPSREATRIGDRNDVRDGCVWCVSE